MPVKLNSTGGGSVTVTSANTATDYTATFPATTGNVVVADTSGTATVTNFYATNVYASGTVQMGSSFLRNRIINGDMRIDQRNSGASVTQSTSVAYTVDRWSCYGSVASKFTAQRNAGSVTPPAGYTNYLGITSSSAYTVGTSEFFFIQQPIEGYNVADLGWGAAGAQTVTLSFWVRSSLTGTFGGTLSNDATNRVYPFTYTISSANTWTQISVTVAGDTSGTWQTGTSAGLVVNFNMGAGATVSGTAGAWSGSTLRAPTGATSVVGTNGATFYVTGVQLEVGSVATPFERRQYGQELALCQRYYSTSPVFVSASTDTFYGSWTYKVSMRTTPTISGGGAGFTNNANSNADVMYAYQTTRGFQTLTASAEL